ncbi:hypothetical protein HNQ77_002291 [Silvibacterium bohemicum]|uniref:Uncharacterized protein n=1 Tax=Silvibacterium bohemicum TaxID=1577686 RepID=A0A841JX78_9BACT|nr:hypothetical protein [Silvibacterium bohemicum]MBB6144339.1 hypothetical protein [Silvibacterium bohemicum]
MSNYFVVEDGKQIASLASLYGAAKLWEENQARRVYHIAPTGPVGPDAWQRGEEVTPIDLREALNT